MRESIHLVIRVASTAVMMFGFCMTLIAEAGLMPNITDSAFVFAFGLLVFLINELENLDD